MLIKRNIEFWKSVKGFSNYEISNMGRIRSLNATRIMQQQFNKGYLTIGLYKNSIRKQVTIHLLVIEHFGDPKPTPKHECNHADGDKSNNWDTNLEWMTGKQNTQHAHDNGLCNPVSGEKHGRSILTKKDVEVIRKLYSTEKYQYKDLGRIFGVDPTTIGCAIRKESWQEF